MEGNGGGPSPSANRRTAGSIQGLRDPSGGSTEHGSPRQIRDLARSFYDRITVAGPEIVSIRVIQAAYSHGLALALPD
jgi:hypothetical protein